MLKSKNKLICILLAIVLCISYILTAFAVDEAYFFLADKTDMIPYTYSSSTVTDELNALVERTEELKNSYSLSKAINILRDLKKTTESITSSDYKNNYDIKHSDKNYEAGKFYKYKYGHVQWIEKNVIYLMLTNSNNKEKELKEMVQTVYDIARIEMSHNTPYPDSMTEVVNMMYVSDSFPESLRNFINFCGTQGANDSMGYEEGKQPSDDSLEDKYQDYLEEQQKQEEMEEEIVNDNSQVGIEEEPIVIQPPSLEDIDIDDIKDGFVDMGNISQSPINDGNANKYISEMNQTYNTKHVTVKTYSMENIYYTLDKTVENPIWNDTGISMEEDEISYEKLLTVLSAIGRNDDFFYMEDSDMVMFIAEGNTLILNKVEKVTKEEINDLFDAFEKLGIKVMLKSDEKVDAKDSLSNKVEKGEINEISVDGNKLILTNKPILTKNVLQLPVIQVGKALGYDVSESGNTITLTYEDKSVSPPEEVESAENVALGEEVEEIDNKITIVLTVGSNNYTVNGTKNSFKTPVTKDNGIVFAEFDKLAQKIGYNYSYDADSGLIIFNK